MAIYSQEDLERLMDEVFYKEERYTAELRLAPEEVEQLSKFASVRCIPMNGHSDIDKKTWYLVQIIEHENPTNL